MKQLLIIAYYYPPLGGIGVLRPLHFSRYLPEYGWNTTVLTVANDTSYPRDESLLSKIPAGQGIVRAYRPPLFEALKRIARKNLREVPLLYSFMDPQFDWVPSAVRTGKRLLAQNEFDAILATAPPFSVLRVAQALKKRFPGPVIGDLRDPFSSNFSIRWPTVLHKAFYRLYERKLLRSLDHLTVVNEVMRDEIQAIIGANQRAPKVIPNGYDPESFAGDYELPKDKFVISYVGSIYGGRSAEPLFRSLAEALKNRPDMHDRLEVVFMGSYQKGEIVRQASDYGLREYLTLEGNRSHGEAIQLMRQSHILVFLGGMMVHAVTGKVYEYAASERPILSFENIRKFGGFVSKAGLGFSVDGLTPDEGAHRIIELFKEFLKGKVSTGAPPERYERYSRPRLTGELAGLLDSLIAGRN